MIRIFDLDGRLLKEVDSDTLRGADLRGANLRRADLRGANLRSARLGDVVDFRGADLQGARLGDVDFRGADLRSANLRRADLRGADLQDANLLYAHLQHADLQHADLQHADLNRANFREANLQSAKLPHFQIPEGELIVWGKKNGLLVQLSIPKEAKRTANIRNRKCRAQYANCLWTETGESVVVSKYYGETVKTVYTPGKTVYPHKYCDDIRLDCAPGIHFFLTKKEAEEWDL